MGYSNALFPANTRKVNFSGLCMEPFNYAQKIHQKLLNGREDKIALEKISTEAFV